MTRSTLTASADNKPSHHGSGCPAATMPCKWAATLRRCRAQDDQRLDLLDDQRTDEVLAGRAGCAATCCRCCRGGLQQDLQASVRHWLCCGPSDWPSSRRSFPQCRSCSAKLDRLPRNGPTAGLAPASMNWSSRLVPRRRRKAWGQRQELDFALRTLMPSRRKATEVALSVSSVSTSRPNGSALRSRQRTSEPTLAGRRSHCPDRSAL